MTLPLLLRWLRRAIQLFLIASAIGLAVIVLQPPPQDLPWTPLKLDEPIGLFTGAKIARLTTDRSSCMDLLHTSGVSFEEVPPRGEDQCRVEDAVRFDSDRALLSLRPASVTPSCPVAIGLIAWQTQVVQPAALALLGMSVKRIEHLGSYACRRLYSRADAPWSEHATSDAIDVGAFILSDGSRISVLDDWDDAGDKGAFLRAVRDGGCGVFATVLSPDYNAAHTDHLHLDQANRGSMGWRACR
ncbi:MULTISPECIES: extensin family protein [unclassified Sphingomonas]|uniref:extensin-like domain-containing protein n=1 Tax=unclassified Sphingomonas TaxID=196159 RepID=UPI000BD5936A|nr:MAG: extensin [Sphingomonas sp. 12-62-6]OYX39391.1 MAG: extensin [Sphingomonas sp. 32-62-10]